MSEAKTKGDRDKAGVASSKAAPIRYWLTPILMLVAVTVAYYDSLSGPFIFDDLLAIVENPSIRQLWPLSEVLSPPHGALTVTGRPLVNLSLAVNYANGGTEVPGYHLTNLAIHLLAGLTLFAILRRTFLRPSLRQRFSDPMLPLAVALLWCVHPLQTEAVTYVVQRAESLMGFFYLLTLYCFIRGTEHNPKFWYWLAIIACLCGMASKEVMVSAPLMVLLYDRTFVAGTFQEAWRRRQPLYLGLAGTWLLLGWLVVGGEMLSHGNAGFQAPIGWQSYGAAEFHAITHYLRLSIWPYPLVLDYGGAVWIPTAAEALPYAFVVLLLLAGTVISLRRWPAIGFAGCWFFGILALTSSVFPLPDTVFEHRMYLPLAAVLTLLVLAIHSGMKRWSHLVFLAMVVACVVVTSRRNSDYQTELSIWRDTVAKRPSNERAHNNLGGVLLKEGRTEEAIAELRTAVQINPGFADAHYNLGQGLQRIALSRGEPLDAAIFEFRRARELNPHDADILSSLGTALAMQEKPGEAIPYLREALQIRPYNSAAHSNLGRALEEQGLLDEALRHYQSAVQINGRSSANHLNLGRVLARLGRRDEATAQFRETLRLEPDNAEAQQLLKAR